MRSWLAVGLVAMVALAGCSKTPPAPVVVKGRVTQADGKPVANMIVTFTAREEGNKSSRPIAMLDAAGQYEVTCIPGKYKVSLAAIPVQAGGGSPAGGGDANVGKLPVAGDQKAIPIKYRDAESSPWEVTITAGQTEDVPVLKMN